MIDRTAVSTMIIGTTVPTTIVEKKVCITTFVGTDVSTRLAITPIIFLFDTKQVQAGAE